MTSFIQSSVGSFVESKHVHECIFLEKNQHKFDEQKYPKENEKKSHRSLKYVLHGGGLAAKKVPEPFTNTF